ncbi:MAG: YcjF family protein [Shewanella sp.]|nr:YcjF family protein [Shewanella sp.]MCF1439755.1 YcjF family protein [Shewanella sp.]MCF1456792.1 YcjF family protein [Shewanella sp.]
MSDKLPHAQPQLHRKQVFNEPINDLDNDEQAPAAAQRFESNQLEPARPLPDGPDIMDPDLSQALSPKRTFSRLTCLMLALLLLLLGVQTGLTLYDAWASSPWLFGFYGTVVGVSLLWLGRGLWREYRLLARLKRSEQNRADGERLLKSMQQGEADEFIEQVCRGLPANADTQRFFQSRRDAHNDAEQLLLFDDLVLQPVDKKARAIVRRYAGESALLLAASPLAVLDMALILWRNQKMIRDVAACYGIELGYWSRVKLFRGIVVNILYAGATEVALDLGSQMLSMELTGKLSGRLAQGLGGGMLTARLGYQAMALCRPLAFRADNRPKLSQLHRELLTELKTFSTKVMDAGKAAENVTRNK